ncbi:hypothetical protein ANO11243_057040 [Dothideomycetidae sp. 11243]|nr:hypothetical protein ANO11243_057040 [fungal sp. No.11243]
MASLTTIILEVTHELTAFAAVFLALTTVAVGLRLFTRGWILKQIALDDYAMIGAYLVKINTAFYIWTMIMIKVSISAFFFRIFSIHAAQRAIVWFLVGTSVASGLVYFLMSMVTCGLEASFIPSTLCPAWHAYAMVSKVWSWDNAATDLCFSLLSIHALWDANMSRMTKFYATLILCLGTAGGVASIVRIVVLTKASSGTGSYAQGLRSGDWTQVETGMGIIAVCLATLRPLLRLLKDKVVSNISTHKNTNGSMPEPHSVVSGAAVVESKGSGTLMSVKTVEVVQKEERLFSKDSAMAWIVICIAQSLNTSN